MNLLEKYKFARTKDIDFEELNRNNVCIIRHSSRDPNREYTQKEFDEIIYEHRDCDTTDTFSWSDAYVTPYVYDTRRDGIPEQRYFDALIKNKNITDLDLYTSGFWHYHKVDQNEILRQLGHHRLKSLTFGQSIRGDPALNVSYNDLISVLEGESFHTLTSLTMKDFTCYEGKNKEKPDYHHIIEIIARMPNLQKLDIDSSEEMYPFDISGKDLLNSKIEYLEVNGIIHDAYALFQNPRLKTISTLVLTWSNQSELEELKEAIRNNKSLVELTLYDADDDLWDYIDELNYIPTLRYLRLSIENYLYDYFNVLSQNPHVSKLRLYINISDDSNMTEASELLWNNENLHKLYLELEHQKDGEFNNIVSQSQSLMNNLTIVDIGFKIDSPIVMNHLQINRILESIISRIIHRLWWI